MQDNTTPKRPLQFHLATLFVFVTVAAGAFALIGWLGFAGFVERLLGALALASIFAPLVEFYYYWKRMLDEGW